MDSPVMLLAIGTLILLALFIGEIGCHNAPAMAISEKRRFIFNEIAPTVCLSKGCRGSVKEVGEPEISLFPDYLRMRISLGDFDDKFRDLICNCEKDPSNNIAHGPLGATLTKASGTGSWGTPGGGMGVSGFIPPTTRMVSEPTGCEEKNK